MKILREFADPIPPTARSLGWHPEVERDQAGLSKTDEARGLGGRRRPVAQWCTAALGCALAMPVCLACAGGTRPATEAARSAQGPRITDGPSPSDTERYCAWFGDEADGELWFGQSPFWWALHQSGGDPRADLAEPGPQWLGRFDLASESLRPPADVTAPGARAGTWDVLVHPSGRVFYTDYFEPAGWFDPSSGTRRRLPAAGLGLNELALGPEGRVLVTRYGYEPDERGSVVVLGARGELLAEYALPAKPGYRPAAKSLAWDPVRAEIWVNTDLFPLGSTGPTGAASVEHDAHVLAADGTPLWRGESPELQFMIFDERGTGWFVERQGSELWMRIRSSQQGRRDRHAGRRVRLDADFAGQWDFAQDIRAVADGSVLVTRWSGRLHRVWPDGRVQDLALPEREGFYYTAVVHGDRICATHCGDVELVCIDAS